LEIERRRFLLVSMHRAENVDIKPHLTRLLHVLNRLCQEFDMPVIVSTHPRTKQRLESAGVTANPLIRFLPPFGYHDYLRLQMDAFCTLSDSGTISEESSILGFPAVTMRTSMERPEAMDSGHIVLTGHDSDTILRSVRFVTNSQDHDRRQPIAEEYDVRNTSHRVVKLILGTAKLGHLWDGIVAA
jgi:UDP-N-acetylglucosamine 2-epimerase